MKVAYKVITCMHKQKLLRISCCMLKMSRCKGHNFETDFVVYGYIDKYTDYVSGWLCVT